MPPPSLPHSAEHATAWTPANRRPDDSGDDTRPMGSSSAPQPGGTHGRRGPRSTSAARKAVANGHPAAAIHEQVLGVVASRICQHDHGERADCCLTMLCDALVASETEFDRTLARVRSQHGLGDEDIVDCYIPAMACQLGTDWAENRRSFAEVTIGTARLIAAVRDLGRRWAADTVADWSAPAMLMVVPETEQHRLGAMIAASRFRRLGVSVRMLLGASDEEVLHCAHNGAFDIIGFSLANLERVEPTRRLIHMLRIRVSSLPPLVAGGAIGVNAKALKSQLGVDHVVSDPEQALRQCGVNVRRRRTSDSSPVPA